MGISTVAIGALPTYRTIGFAAPLLLALCRFGQGLGLGGEWGGAVLLAIENAPPNKRAWYGMFPQLGAPLGFLLSGGVFLLLSQWLTDKQFFAFGWRLPFLASAVLVLLGLYVRLTITETPVFPRGAQVEREPVEGADADGVSAPHGTLVAGILVCLATFVLFYLMTVFALSWGTTALGYSRGRFLLMQLFGIFFFALTIPVSASAGGARTAAGHARGDGGDRCLWPGAGANVYCRNHRRGVMMMAVGLSLMGLTYGPLGTVISELFPTSVRYTGSSLAFSLAGILGASLAPYIATWLAKTYGLQYVGYYLSVAAVLTLVGLLINSRNERRRSGKIESLILRTE